MVETLGVQPAYPSEVVRKFHAFVEFVATDGRAIPDNKRAWDPPAFEDYSSSNGEPEPTRIADLISFNLTFTDDDELTVRLKDRASTNGRTVERETLEILTHALGAEPKYKSELVRKIRAIVDPIGGIELELPPRGELFATGDSSADFTP